MSCPASPRTVDTHIANLRQKIEIHPMTQKLYNNVRDGLQIVNLKAYIKSLYILNNI